MDTFYDFKFKDGVYRLVHKSFRKDTASAVCAKLLGDGASLAVIEDIDEWQFIQAELMAHFHIVTDHLWIEDVDPVQLNLTILTNPSLTTMEHGFDISKILFFIWASLVMLYLMFYCIDPRRWHHASVNIGL